MSKNILTKILGWILFGRDVSTTTESCLLQIDCVNLCKKIKQNLLSISTYTPTCCPKINHGLYL